MKIAFVSANRERMPDEVVPIGILYVMASTPAHHEKVLLDLCFEPDPLAYLAGEIAAHQPDLVALSLRNIQNSDYTGISHNLAYYREVIATVRARSRAPIVIGGSGFSVMPAALVEHLRPDYGISGEGEQAFRMLLEALEAGAPDLGAIPNLHYLVDGMVVSTRPAGAFLDLDALPPPDRSLLDRRYYERVGIESIQTKRGCALKCDYCTYPTIEGAFTRARSPRLIVDELTRALAENAAISHFFFVDSVFNIPPRHAKAVCREMIERGFRTPWTCYANPLGFDDELAGLMARAGCAGMEIGSDSGCDDILDKLRKGFHTDKIRAMRAHCRDHGLLDCHTFILGTPGETMDHVRRTLDFIVDLDPYAAILMTWTDDEEALDPALAVERRRLREEVHDVLRAKQHEFPRWIIPPLGVNFQRRTFEHLRGLGLTGPLWQYIRLKPTARRARV